MSIVAAAAGSCSRGRGRHISAPVDKMIYSFYFSSRKILQVRILIFVGSANLCTFERGACCNLASNRGGCLAATQAYVEEYPMLADLQEPLLNLHRRY